MYNIRWINYIEIYPAILNFRSINDKFFCVTKIAIFSSSTNIILLLLRENDKEIIQAKKKQPANNEIFITMHLHTATNYAINKVWNAFQKFKLELILFKIHCKMSTDRQCKLWTQTDESQCKRTRRIKMKKI